MSLFRRLRHLFRRRRSEAEMAEEMRFHLEQRAADYAAAGLSDAAARLAAQRRFGNTASIQERAREAHGWGWLERLAKDLQLAALNLLRSPGFTLLAVLTLGLGIGANTSMFSVLNGVLLKPLPYDNLPRLEQLYRTTPQDSEGTFSAADFLDLCQGRADYGDFAAYTPGRVSLSDPGQPAQLVLAARATANLLPLLGVKPLLGRSFTAAEGTPGRDRVVILSQRCWRDRYGSRDDIIGRPIRIDGVPHEVVGVLPPSFNDWRHLGNLDFIRPLAFTPDQAGDRRGTPLRVIGHRAATVSPEAAAGFVAGVGTRLAREFPDLNAEAAWRTVSLQSTAGGGGHLVLPMLVGLSAFVLLIACSNLANLLLARTMARTREFAVRGALGASRIQLLRPLVAESLLLAFAGGALAIVVAQWFRDWAAMRSTGDNGEHVNFVVDWGVMGWAFAASLVTAVAFGLAPALYATRLNLNDTLKSGGRGSAGGRGHHRFRQFLIVGQFALAMILLAGAGLFIRGLSDLYHRRSGWESAQLVTGTVVLPAGTYADATRISAFQRLALERLGTLSGAVSASLASATPFFDWTDVRKFHIEGRERPPPGHEPAAMVNAVSPRYFDTFGTRVLAGRTFDTRDAAAATKVCLVSQSTGRAFFGDADPVGRRLARAGGGDDLQWLEIIGIVADIESVNPEPNPVVHRVYLPIAQEPPRQFELAVRAQNADPIALVDGIRAVMTELDPDLPVRKLQPADATIARSLYQLGVLRDMLASFGVLGLCLATMGVYGVIARTMAQRTGEFAIRLALGAGIHDITNLVLASGVKLALYGSAAGLLGALGVARILAASYPRMHLNSLSVLAGTALLLIVVALFACWLPARRAGRIDAIHALRAD